MRCLVILVFAAVAGLVYSEMCTDTNSCIQSGTTLCEHHTHVFCNQDIHQCVCSTAPVTDGQSCTARDDCPSCHHGNERHCVDGYCACSRN